MILVIITVLSFAGAICGVWGLGEKEGICNYDYMGENENENIHN
jgi:hypothetical protein